MQRKQIGLLAASLAAAAAIYGGFALLSRPGPPAGRPGAEVNTSGTESAEVAGGSDPHEWQMLQQQLKNKPGHVPILLRMAQIALDRGDPSEAARLLRQAVAQEPQNLDARLELGRALYESGDAASALIETKQILESNPNHVDALYNLGAIYANTNQVESAVAFWDRAVASDPASESGRKAEIGLRHLSGAIAGGNAQPSALSAEETARLRDVLNSIPRRE